MDELLDVLIESGGKTALCLVPQETAPARTLGSEPLGPRSDAHCKSDQKAIYG